ncbi:MAG: hypothetical protein ACTHXO_03545, partial [Actinomycetaceae bacterium]
VTLVCRTAPRAPISGVDVVHVVAEHRSPLGSIAGSERYQSLDATARRSVPGRLLATLSPLDDTRTVWRAVRADAKAQVLVRQADVAVAVDLPAVRTAWSWLRRGVVPVAVYGVAAAERLASVGPGGHERDRLSRARGEGIERTMSDDLGPSAGEDLLAPARTSRQR